MKRWADFVVSWVLILFVSGNNFLKRVSKSIQDANQVEAIEALLDGFYSLSIDTHLMVSKTIKLILFINPS